MRPTTILILLAGLASSSFMMGLIWFVQVVHYPLMARVGTTEFRPYHASHSRLTTLVVFGPMAIELLSAFWLVIDRPGGVSAWMVWGGLAAATSAWLVTGLVSVPLHERLSAGFCPKAHQQLVRTNWWRVAAWTIHGLIDLAMVRAMLQEIRGR